MDFAHRMSLIPPYLTAEISRLKQEAIKEGRKLIDLGIGDPDQPTPQPIIDALCEWANNPITHRYDESPSGWTPFMESACRWFERRFGEKFDPIKEAYILYGSKDGLSHLVWAIIDKGDICLVPDPAYPVYKVNTLLAGGTPHIMPLLEKNGFLPDLSEIPSDIAKKAKLMFLNYPNNPTTACATLDFFEDVVRFAKEYDIAVCHDCAYTEVAYDGYIAPSFLQAKGARDIGVEMHSLSKMFNMTGWRVGFALGNSEIISMLNKLKSYMDSRNFPAVDMAGAYALDHVVNSPTFNLYKKRRDILVDGLNSLGWKIEKPKATLYVWAPTPSGYSSMEFAKKLLQEADVLVVPGIGYGDYGEGYVRMSLTIEGDREGELMAEAVDRIKKNVAIKW